MMRALNTAGTGLISQQINMDVIANNLANVNTYGFKHQRAEFQDLAYQTFRASGAGQTGLGATPEASQIGLGSRFVSNAANMSQGAALATGSPLDIRISGDGFFQIQMPDGTSTYTRDGSFRLDGTGQLVTVDGYLLEPNITIPTGAQAVTVSANGTVSALIPGSDEPTQLGQITIAVFPNPAGLTRLGQNLYMAGGASGDAAVGNPGENGAGALQSGFLESSNVEVVEEMVRMIVAQRAYEINSKAIQTADEMLAMLNQLKR